MAQITSSLLMSTHRFIDIRSETDEALEYLKKHPQWLARARRSALASLAWNMQQAIRRQYETGEGWPPVKYKDKEGMQFLGRFVRYRVIAGRKAILFMGKSNKGVRPMSSHPWLSRIARKHEYGSTIRVTPRMRRKMAAMGHPMRKSTRSIEIPARPAFHKIWQQWEPKIPQTFEEKFLDNLRRYQSGMSREEWDLMKEERFFDISGGTI